MSLRSRNGVGNVINSKTSMCFGSETTLNRIHELVDQSTSTFNIKSGKIEIVSVQNAGDFTILLYNQTISNSIDEQTGVSTSPPTR